MFKLFDRQQNFYPHHNPGKMPITSQNIKEADNKLIHKQMRNILFTFFLLLSIWSCSQHKTDHSSLADQSVIQVHIPAQHDLTDGKVNANFPFGCTELTELTYPIYWKGDLENYGQLEEKGRIEWDRIQQCFASIHVAATIKSPAYKSLEIIQIGEDFEGAFKMEAVWQKSLDSCRYRLPNIGIYECYYFYERYGNLLLLNPKTKKGKLLNIYADDIGGDSYTMLRYFYFHNEGIKIYEGNVYDDGCTLDEKYKIVINTNGEVNVSPVIPHKN